MQNTEQAGGGFRDFLPLSPAKENRTATGGPLLFCTLFRIEQNEPITERNHSDMSSENNKNSEVESTLKEVIGVLIDGEEGFQKIAHELKDETLKRYFLAESLKRARFKGDLEDVLIKGGVHDAFKEKGTVAGSIHRTWGEIKQAFGGDDHTLLATAEGGEDTAKKTYAEALKKDLPLPVHQLLSEQAAHIQTSHDYVKAARDARK